MTPPAAAGPTGPEPTGPEPTGPEQAGPEPTAPELTGPELTALLARLLTDDDYRERLAAHGPAAVTGNPAERPCLATVDHGELAFTARRFRTDLWHGDGAGGIADAFPRSLALLAARGRPRARLVREFLASPWFGRFRALPYTGEGISLEEAFAGYAMDLPCAAPDGADPAAQDLWYTLRHEMLLALLTALVHERPVSFRTDVPGILPTDHGHATVRTCPARLPARWGASAAADPCSTDVTCLYVCTPRAMAFGPVSRRVADALLRPGEPEAERVRQALRRRGIW
ncbi:hypothetical protein LKL35_27005 [Streptomyces sp. ET3-23]|uniref:hypothetical protein n=1 Tax=Streptomyces sp. ET3-23 TaxID=2885643 RepID=UPI001D103678|nr:hypothetical protein [Streptomyces sp. ET3-23]MCC2279050.1 hypothetical protein [Streptomyces sp. ET3-23]